MSSELTVKCPICGAPYKAYSHYAGDQSACPDCRARARGRTVVTPSTSPEVTYGYYACDKCLSQREFIRGANAEKIAQLESRIAELETELAKFEPCHKWHYRPDTCTESIAEGDVVGTTSWPDPIYHKRGDK